MPKYFHLDPNDHKADLELLMNHQIIDEADDINKDEVNRLMNLLSQRLVQRKEKRHNYINPIMGKGAIMNVHDFPDQFNESHIPDMYKYIFERQEELAQKYTPLEHKNGLRWTTDMPINIHDGKGQAQLKDMAWRTMEEIGESLEAWFDSGISGDNQAELTLHAQEELADGLHFLTELGILAGIKHTDININLDRAIHQGKEILTVDEAVTDFVLRLGTTMNCLKNKPWKCSQYPTDESKFKTNYLLAYESYIVLMLEMMDPINILNLYFRKSNVNQFRIDSNY